MKDKGGFSGILADTARTNRQARSLSYRFTHEEISPVVSIVWLICFKNCWTRIEQLLAQAKAINNLAVPIRVTPVEIVQQAPTLVDHHDQPAAGCVVLNVGLEVRRQVVDPLAQKRNLHFWRSRILYMSPELFDQHSFRCAQVPSPSFPKFVLLSSTHPE